MITKWIPLLLAMAMMPAWGNAADDAGVQFRLHSLSHLRMDHNDLGGRCSWMSESHPPIITLVCAPFGETQQLRIASAFQPPNNQGGPVAIPIPQTVWYAYQSQKDKWLHFACETRYVLDTSRPLGAYVTCPNMPPIPPDAQHFFQLTAYTTDMRTHHTPQGPAVEATVCENPPQWPQ
ncbi:MAG: hypothetical protein HZB16_13220 [Armatimonadetes bacterium]|nr:hypothetical protein [Armatimonadota bacterium]